MVYGNVLAIKLTSYLRLKGFIGDYLGTRKIKVPID